MGNTPSAATAADLLSMPSLACTQTLRSSKRALWIFLLCAAFCAFTANAMDGNNAAPGHAWTPGRHIIAMPESGHPAIMDGTFGAPYWRAEWQKIVYDRQAWRAMVSKIDIYE